MKPVSTRKLDARTKGINAAMRRAAKAAAARPRHWHQALFCPQRETRGRDTVECPARARRNDLSAIALSLSNGRRRMLTPSRFLEELDEGLYENLRIKRGYGW